MNSSAENKEKICMGCQSLTCIGCIYGPFEMTTEGGSDADTEKSG